MISFSSDYTLLLYTPLLALTHRQTDRQTEKQIHLLRMGWRNLFSSCVVSVFCSGRKQVLVYILMYLEYNTVVVVCQFFGCSGKQFLALLTYILSVQYSCAVVSGFWLQQEIVLKMRTYFYYKILLGYFVMIRQSMCVFYTT